jgi:PAS domain S-box-containing protein
VLLLAAYAAAAALGLQWAWIAGAGSPIWPAFGIALAGLYLGGLRLWPAIFLGRLLGGYLAGTGQPLWAEIGIAAVNSIADTAGAWLLLYYARVERGLPGLRDVLWLAAVAFIAGSFSATMGAGVLTLSSGLGAAEAGAVWVDWMLGNVVAGLTLAPMLLSWSVPEAWRRTPAQWWHLFACLAVTALLASGIFLDDGTDWLRAWHIFPVLVWAALAFNVRGTSAALVIASPLALVGASMGIGIVFEPGDTASERIFLGQQFIAVMGLTSLILAAIAHERRRVQDAAQLAAIVTSTPDAIITYSPDGKIRTWNPGAEKLFGYRAREVVGRTGEFLLPPDQPEGPEGVYGLALAEGAIGLETVRIDRSGKAVEVSVTASRMHGPDGALLGVAAVMRDIRERKRKERELRVSESHLSAFFSQSAAGLAEVDLTGRFIRVNDRFCAIAGRSREVLLGLKMQEITHPEDLPGNLPLFQAAIHRGEPFEIEKRYVREDGSIVWVHNAVTSLRGADGEVMSVLAVAIDISDRKRAEQHQRLLINELNHRVKNSLAIVQGIAQQSFKGDAAADPARKAFEGRLAALSAAHNVLTDQRWESASIRQLVDDALAPYGDRNSRFDVEGPDLPLPPKTAVSLALTLHELLTNAVKYGALSSQEGRVRLAWSVEGGRMRLVWRESDGPPVSPPGKRGFGTRMIERGLAADLGGTATIAFEPSGLVCTVDAPLPDADAGQEG